MPRCRDRRPADPARPPPRIALTGKVNSPGHHRKSEWRRADPDGVTQNDPGDGDSGPNRRQNASVLASATVVGQTGRVVGTLNSAPGIAYRVEVQRSSLLGANSVSQISFTRLENAIPVTTSGASISTDAPMVLPSETETVEFAVRRARSREATTVYFTVRDGCGEWKTFVGGGPDAF